MKHSILFIFRLVVFAAIAISVSPSMGQDQAADPAIAAAPSAATNSESSENSPEPVTTANPEIPVEYLDLLLEPLTRDDLLVEVTAWRDLLKDKIQEISEAEIQNRSSTDLNEAAGANEANEDKARADALETLASLREEKAALTDHLNVAIDAYEEKGGDPTEYRQYVLATLGIQVDFTDTTALRAAIKGWLTSENGGAWCSASCWCSRRCWRPSGSCRHSSGDWSAKLSTGARVSPTSSRNSSTP